MAQATLNNSPLLGFLAVSCDSMGLGKSVISLIMLFLRRFAYFVILMLGLHGPLAWSEESEGGAGPVDAVLVLDASGSMLLTDPLQLRLQGAKLFTQFLGKEDRLAVIGFSREAKIYRSLEPFTPDQASEIAQTIDQIGSQGEYTDLLAGIRSAKELLDSSARESARRIIVVLSDGKMEPDPAVGTSEVRTAELVNTVLPDLKAKETKIYTLAFSDQADSALLAELAGATDGLNWFTTTSEKIHESFANLFLAVKKPQVVPLTSKGFKMDDEIDEATFYINKEDAPDVTIISPEGDEITASSDIDGVHWFSGQKFEVVTVEDPAPGDWQVKGITSTDGFATVLTDLKLIAQWPSVIRVDEPEILQARLYDADKPIALPEMSGVVKFGFQITPTDKISEPIMREPLLDDGTSGDRVEGDGVLSHQVTLLEPGEYILSVIAKGPTFQRSQQIPFRVKPKLITLRIQKDDDSDGHGSDHAAEQHGVDQHASQDEHTIHDEHGAHGEEATHKEDHSNTRKSEPERVERGSPHDSIVVELSSEAASLKEIKVTLGAKNSKRQKFDLPLRREGEGHRYKFSAAGFPADGVYELKATLDAQTKRKEHIEAETPVLRFERISSAEDKVDSAVLVVKEKNHQDEKKEDTGPGFPIVPLVVVSALNGGLFLVGKKFLGKLQAGATVQVEPYSPPASILDAISRLDEIAGRTVLEPNDPIFKLALESDAATPPSTSTAKATSSESQAEESASTDEFSENTEGA